MTKQQLVDMALAALSGAANEQTFGASSYLAPEEQARLQREHGTAYKAGAYGSYIPALLAGVGEATLAKKAGTKAATKLIKAMPQEALMSLIAKGTEKLIPAKGWIASGAKGAASALASSKASGAIREKITGEKAPEGEELDTALTGVAGGLLGKALQGAAKSTYSHPALTQGTKDPKQKEEIIKQLMGDELYGGKEAFLNRANEMKGAPNRFRKEVIPRLQFEESLKTQPGNTGAIDISDFKEAARGQINRALKSGDPEKAKDLRKAFSYAIKYGLLPDQGGNTSIKKLFDLSEIANASRMESAGAGKLEQLFAGLNPMISKDISRRQAIKTATDTALQGAIDYLGHGEDLNNFIKANRQAVLGKSLEKGLNKKAPGISSFLDLGKAAIAHTAGALPVRTLTGLAMKDSSPGRIGSIIGRFQAGHIGGDKNAMTRQQAFEHFNETANPEPQTTEEEDPFAEFGAPEKAVIQPKKQQQQIEEEDPFAEFGR